AEQNLVADRHLALEQLEHDPTAALRRLEVEAERGAITRISRQALDLLEPLGPGLRLAGPRAGAQPGDEAFQAPDRGLLARDRPPQSEVACSPLAAPGMPRAGEELAAPRIER